MTPRKKNTNLILVSNEEKKKKMEKNITQRMIIGYEISNLLILKKKQ